MIVFEGGLSIFNGGFTTTTDPVIPRINAIFAFGGGSSLCNQYNLMNQFGVVAKALTTSDGYGTLYPSATTFGSGQAIIGYGTPYQNGSAKGPIYSSRRVNIVTNTGIVGASVDNVLTSKWGVTGTGYGVDTGMFLGGSVSAPNSVNLMYRTKISNTGVPSDSNFNATSTVMTAFAAASRYGTGQAIYTMGIAYRSMSPPTIMPVLLFDINGELVSESTTSSILSFQRGAAAGYGGDKAIFGYGSSDGGSTTSTNTCVRISNTGVPESSVQTAGIPKSTIAAVTLDFDKAIFAFGPGTGGSITTNKVNNQGVVSNDIVQLSVANRSLSAGATIGA